MSRKNTKQQNDWIAEGYKAAQEGLGKDACPKKYDIMYRAAWFVGWERGGGNMKTGETKQAKGES